MDFWPLPIFPDGSLASSVITTVWVGVFVVCLLNLRFGWVLSGLVVPGYIVPLLIAKPISAVVVLLEASLTYGLFWLVSERLSGPSRWSSFFGRDRFMGLILASAAVRLLLDGWLLPIAADHLNARYGLYVNWQHNLHSFGLIVVALLANQMWKPGYVRGMAQALVMIAITFLIVRFGLMELTNFRIGAVVYLYEDFASSVLASPKAYIILITTCFIASRMNLRYGWDFSGILIPALLALQWYQPWKIVTTMVEALVIFFVASALLSSRLFASTNIEGGHKILLFFNISFAYKLLLGHCLAFAGIEHRITDYYGFGYLLPTLIAIKAHDKDILARVSRATVQISFMGALAGSLAGFALTFLWPDRGRVASATARSREEPLRSSAWVAAVAGGSARIEAASREAITIAASDVHSFRTALSMLEKGQSLAEARALLRESGFALRPVDGARLAVVPATGGGVALLFNPHARRRVALQVPEPEAAPGLTLAANALFHEQDARWLIVGGAKTGEGGPGRPPAAEFSRAIALPTIRIVANDLGTPRFLAARDAGTRLNLPALRANLPDLRLGFAVADAHVSELSLPSAAVQRLLARVPAAPFAPTERFSAPELAFIGFDLLEPLFTGSLRSLPAATATAAAVGIQLNKATGPAGVPMIALRRFGQPAQLYLLRLSGSGPVLQLAADEGLSGTGADLFRRLDARAMLIVPNRRMLDGEEAQLLPLITQGILRRAPQGTATIQLRRRPAYPARPGPLLAVDRIEPGGRFADRLLASLRQAGIAARLVEQGPETAGLEISPSPQLRYLQQAIGGRVAIVWLDGAS